MKNTIKIILGAAAVGLLLWAGITYPKPAAVPGGTGGPIVGGVTKVRIGGQTAWTTDLIPSGSFSVNLGSSATTINGIFSKNASHSFGEFTQYASASTGYFGQNKQVQFSATQASISIPFEVTGAYASASAFKGGAFPTTNCTSNNALQWSTTGVFSCSAGSGFLPLSGGTLTGGLFGTTASFSGAVEFQSTASVSGKFTQHSVASNSFTGDWTGNTNGSGWVGTADNILAGLWANIVHAVVTLFVPTTTSTSNSVTATGQFVVNTASKSVDFGDGSNERVNMDARCMAYIPSPLSSIGQQIGKRFFDPFTIDAISPIASPSGNAVGWNLYEGAPGSVTTAIFSANKQASSSTSPKYTSFAQSTISDGGELDVKITSASAVIKQFSITICGHYTK